MEKLNEFPQATRDDWLKLIEKDLAGASFEKKLVSQTLESISLQPLYTESLPEDPWARGPMRESKSGWTIIQDFSQLNDSQLASALSAALQGGVQSIGWSPARSGSWSQLRTILGAIANTTKANANKAGLQHHGLILTSGAEFEAAESELFAACQKESLSPSELQGSLGADPLSSWLSRGGIPAQAETLLKKLGEYASSARSRFPRMRIVRVSASPCHEAGAHSAQEIAYALSAGLAYLKALTAGGFSLREANEQLSFEFQTDAQFFLSIAKLRAARKAWARLTQVSGDACWMHLEVGTSARMMTVRDPWVNLLRTTVACFSAGIAGAESVSVRPYDMRSGYPSSLGHRIARKIQPVLQEESHLHRVADPAGGSYSFEAITEELALKAWTLFQQIEARGGIVTALREGWVQDQIEASWQARLKNIKRRKDPITGVSEFPNIREPALQAAPSAPASAPAPAPDASADPIRGLQPHHLAEPFEQFRDACDLAFKTTGARPRVFLANLGPTSEHGARATFAKNFFETAGIEALDNEGFANVASAVEAFKESDSWFAVICSSDKLYPDWVPEIAKALKEAGAEQVFLAGRPGENEATWKAAGVDEFIYVGCYAWNILSQLLTRMGVMQ